MKKKIKLRDMTEEQYKVWKTTHCFRCEDCVFRLINCCGYRWLDHKDLYSNKFLDQEVEIDVPDILDKEEHDYLEAVIKPWRDIVISIKKGRDSFGSKLQFICISTKLRSYVSLPSFTGGTMYKGMEEDKQYTLEDLGL